MKRTMSALLLAQVHNHHGEFHVAIKNKFIKCKINTRAAWM